MGSGGQKHPPPLCVLGRSDLEEREQSLRNDSRKEGRELSSEWGVVVAWENNVEKLGKRREERKKL